MNKRFIDNSKLSFYTNEQLEQVIQPVVEKVLMRILPALTNLDNGKEQHSLSPCSRTTVTIAEAARMLGISKPKMYELAKLESFPALYVGRKIVIDRTALQEWVQKGGYRQ